MEPAKHPVAQPTAESGAERADWREVGSAQQFVELGPHAVTAGRRELCVLRSATGLSCFEGLCPHQGALLGEGELDGEELVCRNHRWRFDVHGRRVGGPECLKRYPLKEEAGKLWVDIADATRERANAARPSGAARRADQLPHPPRLPLIGNAHQVRPETLHHNFEAWAKSYGCPFEVRLGARRFVAFDDPEAAAQVFRQRPEVFSRYFLIKPIMQEMGIDGVFAAEGDEWRTQRRLAMGALSHKNLRAFYATLHHVALRLVKRWQRAADERLVLDLQQEIMLFTVDATSTLAFARDTNTIERSEDRIQQHLGVIFPALIARMNALVPYWRVLRLPKDRALDRALATLSAWVKELIDETRKLLAREPERRTHPQNLLEAMIAAKSAHGDLFDEGLIHANVMTMLLAGEDTTANTIAWAVHELLEHEESAARVTEEIDRELGTTSVPSDPAVLSRLRYTEAVANETMRLRPVAPLNFFTALENTSVSGVSIERGMHVALLLRVLTTNPAWVPEPARFLPERWLDSEAVANLQRRTIHVPFGSGPRICPGRSLALQEIRVVLALLYKNFRVERVGPESAVSELFAFTMAPRGLKVRLTRRALPG